jgi:sulfatase maturation enzyme AslB (radical SAM superfamily)
VMDPKRKFFLFKQSQHFCSVPWNHFEIQTDGQVFTCSSGRTPLGNLQTNTIEQVVDNFVAIKENLKQDLPDQNCRACNPLEIDQLDYKFLRDLYNPMFTSVDIDYNDSQAFGLSGIDLHWSSTCQLKCITCWAENSSSIAQEQGQPVRHLPQERADNTIDFILANQASLKEIYLSGGEPTLIKHNLRLLEQLRKDLNFTIRINTNMMFDADNAIIAELKKFPKVLFTVSADAMNNRFNYIRRGADWNKFLHNLEELKKLHFMWRVNSVFFVASAEQLADTQEFFMNNFDIDDFTINQVEMGHSYLQARNLPVSTKDKTQQRLLAHREQYASNTNLYAQLTNCLNELVRPRQESYVDFFNNIDQLAGTDWRNTFPELV